MRVLAVDVGNTSTKIALFEDSEIILHDRFSSDQTTDHLHDLLTQETVQYTMLSSTKHLSSEVIRSIEAKTKTYVLSSKMNLPVKIMYDTPETLGADRIAGVVGSLTHFPNATNMVIDAGTCITYDLVREGKFYEGGNISPGIDMRLKAMNTFTDALPLIDASADVSNHGRSTESAIRVGAVWGAVHEVDGFIESFTGRFGKLNVVLTGGSAPYFVNRLKTKIFVSPNLVLRGLGRILQYHVGISN